MDQHAAAVAGQPVGIDATAVRHARQGFQGDVHDLALGIALDPGDQSETTAVVLACGAVEAPIRVCPHLRARRCAGRAAGWEPAPVRREYMPGRAYTRVE